MIRCDEYEINGKPFRLWYSTTDMMIERDGILYETAADPAEFNRTYTETDIPIEGKEPTAEELLAIITGEENEEEKTDD